MYLKKCLDILCVANIVQERNTSAKSCRYFQDSLTVPKADESKKTYGKLKKEKKFIYKKKYN